MQRLSRHITLKCGYFDISVLKNIYRVFENLTAIMFVFGYLKNVLQPGGWPRRQLKCVTHYNKLHTNV